MSRVASVITSGMMSVTADDLQHDLAIWVWKLILIELSHRAEKCVGRPRLIFQSAFWAPGLHS